VRLVNLTQVFRKWAFCSSAEDVTAVNGLTFSIAEGQVFCLLGHNGAGKTTTINILTGLMPPSAGDAWIYGLSIGDEQDRIRRILGVCPQHDILWSHLTALEHLLFYCRLRGVPPHLEGAAATFCLQEVGLAYVANTFAKNLSGGERRRLSIGIALLGKNKLVFLDEPTTGVDPEARRSIWQIISKARQRTTIILTTHSMDEADALSNNIAIVAKGKLRCIGNAVYLKKKYGAGYRLTIHPVGNLDTTFTHVEPLLPPYKKTVDRFANSVCYEFGAENSNIGRLFLNLESKRDEFGIAECIISQTSLEDVFIRTVNEQTEQAEEVEDVDEE